MTTQTRILLSVIYWAFIAYVLLPLAMMILMGFKDSKFIGFPITNWTLDWYIEVFHNTELLGIIGYSMAIAIISTVLAIVIGVWAAMLLGHSNFRGKVVIFALICLPAVIPGIISAISLRIFSQAINIDPGFWAIILGHTIHNVPFVALVVMARLNSQPISYIEAARDLGADDIIAFIRVTIPYLMPALIGAGIFCMLTSFDDFVRSFFLGGYQPTLPVYIFGQLRTGMSPEINAISTIVLLVSAAMGLFAERIIKRRSKDS